MKILSFFRRHLDIVIVAMIIAMALSVAAWWLPNYEKNYQYGLFTYNLSNSDYYLQGSKLLSQTTYSLSKNGNYVTDIHLILPVNHSREMIQKSPIFTECGPNFTKCTDGTWDSYEYFVTSYNKTYYIINSYGQYVKQDVNPAVPYLSTNQDVKQIVCAVHQVRTKTAYGLCINPDSGELWYHSYNYGIYDPTPGS